MQNGELQAKTVMVLFTARGVFVAAGMCHADAQADIAKENIELKQRVAVFHSPLDGCSDFDLIGCLMVYLLR